MNISQMLFRMAGEWNKPDARAVELHAGQTVRGVLLGMTGDGEALVQIDGVQIRAVLQQAGNVQPGMLAQFLVLPESGGGQLTLRAVEAEAMPERGAAAVLRQLGLKDVPEHRAQLQLMQREGLPLTKDMFVSMKEALAAKPAAVPAESWTQTLVAAAGKGLPMTREALQALLVPPAG